MCKCKYPTIAEIKAASEEQLYKWHDNLPKPETATEVAIMRKINKTCWVNSEAVLRKSDPRAADMLVQLAEDITKILGHDAREL